MLQGKILYHGPMVKRSRHRPFTAVTRVRFPVGSPEKSQPQQAGIFSFSTGNRSQTWETGEKRRPLWGLRRRSARASVMRAPKGLRSKAFLIPGRVTREIPASAGWDFLFSAGNRSRTWETGRARTPLRGVCRRSARAAVRHSEALLGLDEKRF